MTVRPLGIVREGGGTLFVAVGAPNTAIAWTLTGPGTLTPRGDRTDAAGVASARYDATGAVAGASITVTAEAYA